MKKEKKKAFPMRLTKETLQWIENLKARYAAEKTAGLSEYSTFCDLFNAVLCDALKREWRKVD